MLPILRTRGSRSQQIVPRTPLSKFKLNMSTREYEAFGASVAPEVELVPDLIPKTWIWDERTLEAERNLPVRESERF